jgi:hypothetical protein
LQRVCKAAHVKGVGKIVTRTLVTSSSGRTGIPAPPPTARSSKSCLRNNKNILGKTEFLIKNF